MTSGSGFTILGGSVFTSTGTVSSFGTGAGGAGVGVATGVGALIGYFIYTFAFIGTYGAGTLGIGIYDLMT